MREVASSFPRIPVLRRDWLGSPVWEWIVAVGVLFGAFLFLSYAQFPPRPANVPPIDVRPASVLLWAGLAAATTVAWWAAMTAFYRWFMADAVRGHTARHSILPPPGRAQ